MPKKEKLSNKEVQKALIENFVNLQKVLTNLSVKFDNLSDQISRLLQLFEISAKTFIKKTEEGAIEDKDLLYKLDTLLDQNKTIARGLTLIEEKIRHKTTESQAFVKSNKTSEESPKRKEIGEKPTPKPLPRI